MASDFIFSLPDIEKAQPIRKRIQVIDALRGFALLGMVLTHSYDSFWQLSKAEILNSDLLVLSPLDRLFDLGADTLLVRKFYTIFSFLFGLGFAIQFQSAKAKGKPIIGRFIWRLLILLSIGILSQLAIHSGKILQTYALLGLVLIFTHKWKDHYLLLASISLFLVNNLLLLKGIQFNESQGSHSISSPITLLGWHIHPFILDNSLNWFLAEFAGGRLLMEASLFLFGQYIGRKKLFLDTEQNRSTLKKAAYWGGGLALASTATIAIGKLGGLLDLSAFSSFLSPESFFEQVKRIQQISLSIFYVAGLALLYRIKLFQYLLDKLVPAGKMALTLFILQAGLLLSLHYTGLMHKWGMGVAIGTGLFLFTCLAIFAGFWMQHFRQGPLEWAWKTLTYLKVQPVRNPKTSVSAN